MRISSLGFGDDQHISEEEQVSVLSLESGLELSVSVQEKRPVEAGQEGLDKRAGLGTNGNHKAVSATQPHELHLD